MLKTHPVKNGVLDGSRAFHAGDEAGGFRPGNNGDCFDWIGISREPNQKRTGLWRPAENRIDQVDRVAHIAGQQHSALDAVDEARAAKPVADDKQR
jgi:hypothetical protein